MSVTITNLAVLVLLKAFEWAGVSVGSEEVNGFVTTVIGLVAFVGVWWGRVRHGDITWYGKKRS